MAWGVSSPEGQSAASYSTDLPQVLACSGMCTTVHEGVRDNNRMLEIRHNAHAQAWVTSQMSIYFTGTVHVLEVETRAHAEGWERHQHRHTAGALAYSEATPGCKSKNLTLYIQILPLKRKDYNTCHISPVVCLDCKWIRSRNCLSMSTAPPQSSPSQGWSVTHHHSSSLS